MNDSYHAQPLMREKVFRDPVHDYVHVQDPVILQLIDTREFQRLRRIKQLGTSSFTFHGAEHTRFTHSLGVYELTRRIINNFARNYPTQVAGDGLWDDSERLVALCAALLHDIGHGPFSHTFEKIFHSNHEHITQQIITSPETEINQILTEVAPDFPERVASVINKTYPNQQVIQLISSQVDADRMDYLLRDAYFTGVSYGNFDLTRILRVIRPYQDQIVFDFSGMHAIEDYIISRYQMYMQVYFHPVSRGMETVLTNLFARAKYCYQQQRDQMKTQADLLEPFLARQWMVSDYLQLDDHVISALFTQWTQDNDPILADLASRFLSRRPFKSMIVTDDDRMELTTAIHNELRAHGYDVDYYFGESSSFDLPYDYYRPHEPASGKIQIDLLTKTGQEVELSQVSPLVRSITGRERGDQRLFFPRELLSALYQIPAADRNSDQVMIILAHKQESNDVTHHLQGRLF